MDIDKEDIAEVYSSTRVTSGRQVQLEARRVVGLADAVGFTKEKERMRAHEIVHRDQRQLIIGSPPCTAFPTLQKINEAKWRGRPSKEKKGQELLKEAVSHMEFCVSMIMGLASQTQALLQDKRVMQIKADMCRFGMICEEPGGT